MSNPFTSVRDAVVEAIRLLPAVSGPPVPVMKVNFVEEVFWLTPRKLIAVALTSASGTDLEGGLGDRLERPAFLLIPVIVKSVGEGAPTQALEAGGEIEDLCGAILGSYNTGPGIRGLQFSTPETGPFWLMLAQSVVQPDPRYTAGVGGPLAQVLMFRTTECVL